MAEKEKSVGWVIVMVMLVIAGFGWAFMAAGYAHAEAGWRTQGVTGSSGGAGIRYKSREAIAEFFANAIAQIPNVFSVLAYNMKHRIWLPILFIVLEIAACFGGYKMKQLEKQLQNEPRPRR